MAGPGRRPSRAARGARRAPACGSTSGTPRNSSSVSLRSWASCSSVASAVDREGEADVLEADGRLLVDAERAAEVEVTLGAHRARAQRDLEGGRDRLTQGHAGLQATSANRADNVARAQIGARCLPGRLVQAGDPRTRQRCRLDLVRRRPRIEGAVSLQGSRSRRLGVLLRYFCLSGACQGAKGGPASMRCLRQSARHVSVWLGGQKKE